MCNKVGNRAVCACKPEEQFKLKADNRTCEEGMLNFLALISLIPLQCRCIPFIHLIFSFSVHPCDVNNGGCSHVCKKKGDEVLCECPIGFELARNTKTCVPGKHSFVWIT